MEIKEKGSSEGPQQEKRTWNSGVDKGMEPEKI